MKNKLLPTILSIATLSFIIAGSTCADNPANINYSVTVEPALNITTSSNKVSLNLDPREGHDFDAQDLTVSVSTNNENGYRLHLSADSTNLVEKTNPGLYIQTLENEVTTENFTANRWGYKLDSSATKFSPFTRNILLNYSSSSADGAATGDSNTLTFAAKVDYGTKAGAYVLGLNFQATANPNYPIMQEFTKAMCQAQASSNNVIVMDVRDGQEYTVRYINGNCWMTRNLAIGCNGSGLSYGDAVKNITLTSNDSNISSNYSTATLLFSDASTSTEAADYYQGRIQCDSTYGAWYNYYNATAGTISGPSNSAEDVYNICPKGWTLPTYNIARSVTGYRDAFSPVLGGFWHNGEHRTTHQIWWSTTPVTATTRYYIIYGNNGSLSTYHDGSALTGMYARCIRSS